jgi:hypothetical protein
VQNGWIARFDKLCPGFLQKSDTIVGKFLESNFLGLDDPGAGELDGFNAKPF